MSKLPESPLLTAARKLAEDLTRFEAQSTELGKLAINSDKSLQRARQALQTCSEQETQLADSLRQFAQAMQQMQQTQQRSMEATALAAEHIAQRQVERAELQDRLVTLGERAREVSAPVSDLNEPGHDFLGPLREVERRLAEIIDEAGELHELSRQGDWADFTRDTQALREQLQALKNRVHLMSQKLATTLPS